MSIDWVYFTEKEMQCRGTGECNMDEKFMEKLSHLREDYNKPMIITSGYRSQAHNSAVGGSPNSAHVHGRAVDILVSGNEAYDILSLAFKHGFTGIGVAQRGAHNKRFIHIDDMDDSDRSPRPSVWSYK